MIGVYILRSLKNDTYYIGSTNNKERRLQEHKEGKSIYTRNILPIELVFFLEFKTLILARKAEYWIKKQKSKEFIERIIEEGRLSKQFR